MSCSNMNRREFVGLTTTSIAGGVLGLSAPNAAGGKTEEWDPDRPFVVTGRKLTVQPILMYRIPERRDATSWKSWGGVQTESAASEEAERISKELNALSTETSLFRISSSIARNSPAITIRPLPRSKICSKVNCPSL